MIRLVARTVLGVGFKVIILYRHDYIIGLVMGLLTTPRVRDAPLPLNSAGGGSIEPPTTNHMPLVCPSLLLLLS